VLSGLTNICLPACLPAWVAGFCYINDCVLGILELLKHHPRCAALAARYVALHCSCHG
jgi:hypothetical protein